MTPQEWNGAVSQLMKAGFKFHSNCNCLSRSSKFRKDQWFIKMARTTGFVFLMHRNMTIMTKNFKDLHELIEKVIQEKTNLSY